MPDEDVMLSIDLLFPTKRLSESDLNIDFNILITNIKKINEQNAAFSDKSVLL